jgi:hypothetical protein
MRELRIGSDVSETNIEKVLYFLEININRSLVNFHTFSPCTTCFTKSASLIGGAEIDSLAAANQSAP